MFKPGLCCLAGLLLFPALVVSQTNLGGISGTVFDSSGAPVAGAKVRITNSGTNASLNLLTSADGAYSATQLEPVVYRVQVEMPGFKTAILDNVKVDTAATVKADLTLDPGAVETKVTVNAAPPVVNTESGALSFTIVERQIVDLPIAERSVLQLALTAPNVNGEAGSEYPSIGAGQPAPGAGLSINGGRQASSAMLADGANNTSVGIGRAMATFTPDVVQEFTVQSNAFSAEYGTSGGGIINVTTKSGTNRFSGMVYGFIRNPALNAKPFTLQSVNRPVSDRRQTQIGLLHGGPVVIPKLYNGRNRTFYFFAVEPQRIVDGASIDGLRPTDAMRKGDFSDAVNIDGGITTRAIANQYGMKILGDATVYQQVSLVGDKLLRMSLPATGTYLPFPGGKLPATYMDPISLKLLDYLGKEGNYFVNAAGQLRNWAGKRNVVNNEKRWSARLDHNVTTDNRLFFRISHIPIAGYRYVVDPVTGINPVNALVGDNSDTGQYLVSDTHILKPTVINDLRVNYSRGNYTRTNPPEFQTRNLSTELGLPSVEAAGLPVFTPVVNDSWSLIGQRSIASLGVQIDENMGLADTLSITRGNMTWKIGIDFRKAKLKTSTTAYAQGGEYGFGVQVTGSAITNPSGGAPFASFLLGVPSSLRIANSTIPYYYRWGAYAGFVQNDWKVRPNLTINLGMRYSLAIPRWEKFDHQGTFLPELAQGVPLPKPFTTVTGEVLTQANVIPFGFAGLGGRSRYLMPVEKTNFEPRFGFAWVPRFGWNTNNRLVVRGGYGLSHVPLTGLGGTASPDFSGTPTVYSYNTGGADPTYLMRMTGNLPKITALTPNQVMNIPSDGLVVNNSLAIPGYIVSNNTRVPSVQSWNVTIASQLNTKLAIELAYAGNKGTHLFAPPRDTNLRSFPYMQALYAAGQSPDIQITDPLGRRSASGTVLTIPQGSVASPYFGFDNLYTFLDSSGNSIRHGGYVSVRRRMDHGLYLTANYTWAKSIDEASDAGQPQLTSAYRTDGQSKYGAPRNLDRAASSFDIRHQISSTFLWDLPVRRQGWRVLRSVVNHWTISGTGRLQGSFPFQAVLLDANQMSIGNDTSVRPSITPGQPLLNPLYSKSCPIDGNCEPFVNQAAFYRPPFGQLGNAPRTFDGVRGPMKRYLDLSVQKNFYPFGRDTGRKLQFRADAINVFNHPIFGFSGAGSARSFQNPNQSPITAAEYDLWAAFNNKPLSTTAEGQNNIKTIQSLVTAQRIPGTSLLPANYFSVPVPQGFATKNPLSYDITQLDQYKLYRLRNSFYPSFGSFTSIGQPRFIQLSIKLYF